MNSINTQATAPNEQKIQNYYNELRDPFYARFEQIVTRLSKNPDAEDLAAFVAAQNAFSVGVIRVLVETLKHGNLYSPAVHNGIKASLLNALGEAPNETTTTTAKPNH